MLDDEKLEQSVQNLIVDLCEVLFKQGFEQVPVGAVMRLVGVNPTRAAEHDAEYFALDDEFKAVLELRKTPVEVPTGATLH